MRRSLIWLFCLGLLLLAGRANAQPNLAALQGLDVSAISVDALSDAQILQALRQAEAMGLTVQDLEQMALARGVKPIEVMKLRQRIEGLRSQTGAAPGANTTATPPAATDPLSLLALAKVAYQALADTATTRPAPLPTRPRLFGKDLFNSASLTFEPSLTIPTPINYRLAPGDELTITVWGAAQANYSVPVRPDGTVRVENLGPIFVNGLTIEEAERMILSRMGQVYSGLNRSDNAGTGTFGDVTLARLRSIKVHILGEVERPGSYTLPALATVFNALYQSGGPTRDGTFRRIQVLRNGAVATELDVYDFLVHGDQSSDLRLQDQDVIKVDPYLAHVAVEGEVKRPGLFEVEPGETLSDLLAFAGSFTGDAYTRRVKVYRNTATERAILTVPADDYATFDLRGGDEVRVEPVLERFANRVEVRGAVFREGDYELDDAGTVYGLLQRAEGLRGDAFLARGHIYRTRPDLSLELISFDLKKLLEDPLQHDVMLQKDDVVVIPSKFALQEEYAVEVKGAVQQPGEHEYLDNMTLQDLIVMAGGFREEASLLRVEVARRRTDGTATGTPGKIADIFYFDIGDDLGLSDEGRRFVLQPFDQVFVRRSPGYIEQRNVAVTGEVLYPGTYTIESKDDRVSDLIARAGGLTAEAYPKGGRLIRRRQGSAGPVGIDLADILRVENSPLDLLVEDGDSIHVPLRLETVKVEGAVYYPVSVRFARSLGLKDYVTRAGGVTDQADFGKTYVVYANGSVDRVRRRLLFFRDYPEMEPGANIIVPAKPARQGLSSQERILLLSSLVSVAAIVSTTIVQLRN